MRIATFLLAAAVSGFVPALARAADAPAAVPAPAAPAPTTDKALTDAQRAEVESIIHEYLTKTNPNVLKEAMQVIQNRDEASAKEKSEDEVSKVKDGLFSDPDSPSSGNPKADVTIVEFYDYNCGYCKMSEDGLETLLKEDKKLRLIYKEFPILGPESMVAARASIAATRQPGKFVIFHNALMSKHDHLSDEMIFQTAKDSGLNIDKLKKDMADPATQKIIDADLELGGKIGVRGTPMFVVNEHVYPGAVMYDQLKKLVETERSPQPAQP